MSITRGQPLKYLQEVRNHYSAYHNHKETSGWAAVAIYLAITIQIAGGASNTIAVGEKFGRTLVIILLAIAIVKYVAFQLAAREKAANYVAACFALITEYIGDEASDVPNEELFKLTSTSDSQYQAPYILPQIILHKAKDFENKGQGTRMGLERTMYFTVATATLASVTTMWLR